MSDAIFLIIITLVKIDHWSLSFWKEEEEENSFHIPKSGQ
jgi:hypothetical protein